METKGLGSDLEAVIKACVELVTDTEASARLFEDQHPEMVAHKRYFRFNVEQGLQGIGFEEGDTLNLMEAATNDYLDGLTRQLSQCAELLRHPSPPPYNKPYPSPLQSSTFATNSVTIRDLRFWLGVQPEYEQPWPDSEDLNNTSTAQGDLRRNLAFRFDETCEWINAKPEYQRWAQALCTTSLWIKGIPGCGKSILAASIAHHFHATSPVAIFFCDSKDETKLSAPGVLSNLVSQLYEAAPTSVGRVIEIEYRKSGQNKIQQTYLLEKIFTAALQEISDLVLLIDALDELDQYGLDVVCEVLKEVQDLCFPVTKLCITSRDDAQFVEKLAFCNETVQISKTDLLHDLEIFVAGSLCRNNRIQALLAVHQDFVQEIKVALINSSDGQFLLPRYTIQDIQSKQTIEKMRHVLHTMPRNLGAY